MEVPSVYTGWEMDDVLDDLSVRFIINLPQEELVSTERVCFQIEEAYWYYDDFVRENSDKLKRIHLHTFLAKIFEHNPMLSKWGMSQKAYQDFIEYKRGVPVRGGILMNEKMDKVILVKGFKASNWAFPRGKINKDEPDHICAIREVLEETGFDSSDLIEPDEFLVDMEDKGLKHLQLYLIRNVPEDFNFGPLARKEISDIAWFPLADLRAYAKRDAARDPTDDQPGHKFKQFKVYSFLPGINRWIRDQRKIDRQKAKNQRKAGGVYETEPESSAVEASPQKTRHGHRSIVNSQPPTAIHPTADFPAPGPTIAPFDENAISAASAKLREMVGIVPATATHRTFESTAEKPNPGQTLLAQLQASAGGAPTPPPPRPPMGVPIPLSSLFPGNTQHQSVGTPTGHPSMAPFHTSPPANFNPSQPPSRHYPPQGPRPGQSQYSNLPYQQSPKQQVTILQRGQPLPNGSISGQPSNTSPVTPKQANQPQHGPSQIGHQHPDTLPPDHHQQSEAPQPITDDQDQGSSPMKMARRPLLTIDAFTPPTPAKPPTSEHKGNLLDILRGSKPPPPPHPAMQLQRPNDAAQDSPQSYPDQADIQTHQGIPISLPFIPPAHGGVQLGNLAPSHNSQQSSIDPTQMARIVNSVTSYNPKKVLPPDTSESNEYGQPAENISAGDSLQPKNPSANTASPITPAMNSAIPDTLTPPPATNKADTVGKSGSFDRRGTVKPEQAQTLLGLLKAQSNEPNANPGPQPPTSVQQNRNNSKTAPAMMAPEMSRTSSLRADQTAFLMNLLDNLATKHGF